MQKRVLLRTANKLGKFFGLLILIVGGIFATSWLGLHLFNDPLLGNLFFIGVGTLGFLVFFSYNESKSEIEEENRQLVRELNKHG